jgi:hypothetical protein
LLLSGLAALTYQVVWVRLLGLSMGSTAASVSTVLAAFFGGLALGSALADRLTRNRPGIDAYLGLEAVIGIAGLALLPVLLRLDSLVAALPVMGSSLGVKFVVTVVLLSIPTVCMGATFPVMADLLARGRSDIGGRLSFLYSLNTWGAVAGAGLAGFVLIPRLGLDGAVMVAAACNAAIVVVGLATRRRFLTADATREKPAGSAHPASATAPPEAVVHAPHALFALGALITTGFCSIAAEVGWTKYLAIFTGATLYGFATILVVFLAGIALGSWLVRPLLGREQRTAELLLWGLILLGLAVALTRPALSLGHRQWRRAVCRLRVRAGRAVAAHPAVRRAVPGEPRAVLRPRRLRACPVGASLCAQYVGGNRRIRGRGLLGDPGLGYGPAAARSRAAVSGRRAPRDCRDPSRAFDRERGAAAHGGGRGPGCGIHCSLAARSRLSAARARGDDARSGNRRG